MYTPQHFTIWMVIFLLNTTFNKLWIKDHTKIEFQHLNFVLLSDPYMLLFKLFFSQNLSWRGHPGYRCFGHFWPSSDRSFSVMTVRNGQTWKIPLSMRDSGTKERGEPEKEAANANGSCICMCNEYTGPTGSWLFRSFRNRFPGSIRYLCECNCVYTIHSKI